MAESDVILEVRDLHIWYGSFRAVKDVTMGIEQNKVTALIGPSGCGKSTLLRCFNRMNELVPGAHIDGEVLYHDEDIYADYMDATEIRSKIGMVFQKPNPFPQVHLPERLLRPANQRVQGRRVRGSRAGPSQGRPLERGEGAAKRARPDPFRGPAAASLHRQGPRRGARGLAHGRALLGPRPHSHPRHRRPYPGTFHRDHHCYSHPQHAAGGPGLRPDRLPDDGRRPCRLPRRGAGPPTISSPTPKKREPRPT